MSRPEPEAPADPFLHTELFATLAASAVYLGILSAVLIVYVF